MQEFVYRDYQINALEETYMREQSGVNRQLWVMPTGSGKTPTFAGLTKLYPGEAGLVLAHRGELLDQAARSILTVSPGLTVGIEQAGLTAPANADVVVASVPTVGREKGISRLDKFFKRFRWIVTDEAHHATATTYRNVYEHLGFSCDKDNRVAPAETLMLGVTATPKRTDNIGLEYVFDDIAFARSSRWMIEQGYLTDLSYHRVYSDESLDNVAVRRGEFAEDELADAVNTVRRNQLIVSSYVQYSKDKRAIVFCVDVEHVHDVTNLFVMAGIKAESITGDTPAKLRKATIRRFREGETKVLVNCMVATEGFDVPRIDCVILARPTKSSLVYIQMLGRGMRTTANLRRTDAITR